MAYKIDGKKGERETKKFRKVYCEKQRTKRKEDFFLLMSTRKNLFADLQLIF